MKFLQDFYDLLPMVIRKMEFIEIIYANKLGIGVAQHLWYYLLIIDSKCYACWILIVFFLFFAIMVFMWFLYLLTLFPMKARYCSLPRYTLISILFTYSLLLCISCFYYMSYNFLYPLISWLIVIIISTWLVETYMLLWHRKMFVTILSWYVTWPLALVSSFS